MLQSKSEVERFGHLPSSVFTRKICCWKQINNFSMNDLLFSVVPSFFTRFSSVIF